MHGTKCEELLAQLMISPKMGHITNAKQDTSHANAKFSWQIFEAIWSKCLNGVVIPSHLWLIFKFQNSLSLKHQFQGWAETRWRSEGNVRRDPLQTILEVNSYLSIYLGYNLMILLSRENIEFQQYHITPLSEAWAYQDILLQGNGHIRDALSPLPVHWHIFPCCLHDLSFQGFISIYNGIKDENRITMQRML